MNLAEEERIAIERLKSFEPETEPYYLCYSGGKDSDVIRILAQLAGVRHEIHHNLTSVDAPETVRYVKSIPNVIIDIPHDKDGKRVSIERLTECLKHIRENNIRGKPALMCSTGGQALTAISLHSTHKNNRLRAQTGENKKYFNTAIIAQHGGKVNVYCRKKHDQINRHRRHTI